MLDSSGLDCPGAHDFVVSGYLSRATQSIFELPVCFTTPSSAMYHLSHVQSSQPYILPLCRSAHSFTRWTRWYSQGRTRTRPEKDVSITLPIHQVRSVDWPSSRLHHIIELREKKMFSLFSCTLFRPLAISPDCKDNRDDTWTMCGLTAWLAHVFRLRGRIDKVSKQRCLWLFQFLSDECSLGSSRQTNSQEDEENIRIVE